MEREFRLLVPQSKTVQNLSTMLSAMATQTQKITMAVTEMTSLLQQVGRKKERQHLRFPKSILREQKGLL